MAEKFPIYAINCIKTIESHGFEAWFVGGCVRDMLLNRPFYDIDIATNALPEDIIKMFDHTIPTGIKHGTVTVVLDDNNIEITTYRSDGLYNDNRHPENVKFETNIKNDLSRRDFTVNALAYHYSGKLIDLFGGMNDLKNMVIKCVGMPEERFKEDALRILRCYRFASTLGFSIHEATEKAAIGLGELVRNVSGERILVELKKLTSGKSFDAFAKFVNKGLLEFCGIGKLKNNIDTLLTSNTSYRLPVFLMLTEFDIQKFKDILKPDNALLSSIKALKEMAINEVPQNKRDIKLLLYKYSKENVIIYFEYLKVLGIDTNNIFCLLEEIEANNEPYLLNHLNVNGNDLIKLGFSGKELGRKLHELCLLVIENPEKNNKSDLLKFNH